MQPRRHAAQRLHRHDAWHAAELAHHLARLRLDQGHRHVLVLSLEEMGFHQVFDGVDPLQRADQHRDG